MLKIENLEEKQLLVAGYFINKKEKGIGIQDKDIFQQWTKYFPDDFHLRKKKYRYQRFIYGEEKEYGCLTLPDTKYIRKYVIANYNKLWKSCSIAVENYIEKYTKDDWDKEITKLRKKHERHLKLKSTALGGYAEINHWRTDRLSTYHIWLDGGEFIGNYKICLDCLEQVKRERRYKERFR